MSYYGRKRSISPVFAVALLAPILVIGGNFIGSGIEYSEGDRIGHIDKFSNKGMIWKTDEGQLSMRNFVSDGNGGMSNAFEFSVRAEDQGIIDQINAAQENGSCVKLDYSQTLGALPWEQGTTYRITGVKELDTDCKAGPSLGS